MSRGPLWSLLGFHGGATALALWVGSGEVLWTLVSGPAVISGLLLGDRKDRRTAWAGGLLLAGTAAVLAAHASLDRFAREWPERSAAREVEAQARLAGAFDTLLAAGEEAASRLSAVASETPLGMSAFRPGLRAEGVDALALFGPSGELLAWDGSHQGPIPADVRGGASRYMYREGALFGYLYVTEPVAGGGTAVAASLLRSELPPPLVPPGVDFRSRFEDASGARIEVSRAEHALGASVFDVGWEDRVLLSVTLLPASEGEERARHEMLWMRGVTLLLLAGWLLSLLAAKADPLGPAVAGGSLVTFVLALPVGRLTGLADAFSPADFLLAGPLPLTIEDLLALGLGGALALGMLRTGRVSRISALGASLAATALATGALLLCEVGASRDFLAQGEAGWIAFQGATVGLSLLVMGMVASLGAPGSGTEDRGRPVVLGAAVLGALALSLGWAALAGQIPAGRSAWLAMLWTVPAWGVLAGAPAGPTWSRHLLRYVFLSVLSVTLVLPWAWNLRVQARIQVAEERVERLGTRPDPFLEFLLLRWGERVRELAAEEREPVEVLYGAWTESGLAQEGVPLWITFWSADGTPRDELQIGVSGTRPPLREDVTAAAEASGEPVVRRFDLADTHYVGVAPLTRGAFVSAILPPRRMLTGASPLGPLFSPARGTPDPLVLIPALPGEVPGTTEGIEWVRTNQGWQGETYVAYPDDGYHAHYLVELPGWILLLARATLLLLLNVGILGLFWTAGRWLQEGGPARAVQWIATLTTFRGRVTAALFAFFLTPSILFGTLAYRTLSAAALRTADSLATRAAEDAASWYAEVEGAMDVLAGRVGSDLLLYENGDLVGGSNPELLELGLYEGWLPPAVDAGVRSGEDLMTTATASLGGWDYVVAYRRIGGGRTLAAPAPLQAGAMALGQRDVADLLGFSVVMGAVLSTLLALLVGRALARPIQTLRVGSERVGGGNMAVRLPDGRSDEFGAVFDAFNRMVDRLSKARRALLRSSRRTRAIVEEVATGVVALDVRGDVRLVNPRAERLIGTAVKLGAPLPGGEMTGDGREALAAWVRAYLSDGLPEASEEISFGERRVRVRARRISRRGPPGGVVLTLEDVTDELRTERILAWGDMAQQVAHEVKNPLTPMKLGVQHIRRAWEDRRSDFAEILEKNVEAILEEIDRLASVASSFSRFAAPAPHGGTSLEPVHLDEVVGEVLDLYRAGDGPVRFEYSGGSGLPPVRARSGEMKEVLVNLLENARTALPSGGTVCLEALESETGVELQVRDEGTGITPDLLPRVFEPHFSTRSGGTGLGLAIVRRLVESWGGTVRAESRPGRGTVIWMHLAPWVGPRANDSGVGADGGSVPRADS